MGVAISNFFVQMTSFVEIQFKARSVAARLCSEVRSKYNFMTSLAAVLKRLGRLWSGQYNHLALSWATSSYKQPLWWPGSERDLFNCDKHCLFGGPDCQMFTFLFCNMDGIQPLFPVRAYKVVHELNNANKLKIPVKSFGQGHKSTW